MGQTNDKKAEKGKTRGSKRVHREARGVADWANANAAMLQAAILLITAQGGAIRIGYTRDGGAYAIGIYGDGEPYTDYVRPDEEIDEYLRELIANYE